MSATSTPYSTSQNSTAATWSHRNSGVADMRSGGARVARAGQEGAAARPGEGGGEGVSESVGAGRAVRALRPVPRRTEAPNTRCGAVRAATPGAGSCRPTAGGACVRACAARMHASCCCCARAWFPPTQGSEPNTHAPTRTCEAAVGRAAHHFCEHVHRLHDRAGGDTEQEGAAHGVEEGRLLGVDLLLWVAVGGVGAAAGRRVGVFGPPGGGCCRAHATVVDDSSGRRQAGPAAAAGRATPRMGWFLHQ
jgi:hypothetical protein